jgi:hypothetical protein
MNLLFVDESGSPLFNYPSSIFSLVGVCINEVHYRDLTYEYNLLKRTYFPGIYGIEPRTLPTMYQKLEMLKKRECKNILTPNEICYPHRKFLYKVMDLCAKYHVKLFMVTAFKDKLPNKNPDWLYPACLKILTRGYNKWLMANGTKGLIIMDSRRDTLDDSMTYIQSSFLLWGKEGKTYDHVIDLPFFAASHLSVSLQIAHYFVYITAVHYHHERYNPKKYVYQEPLWKELHKLFPEKINESGKNIIMCP